MDLKLRVHMLKLLRGVPEEDYFALRKEVSSLAMESVKRDKLVAELEAEVIRLNFSLKKKKSSKQKKTTEVESG